MKATFLFISIIFLFLPVNRVEASEVKVTISEILPDALGSDSGKEYIELFSPSELLLKDWYFINTSQSGTFKKITIPEINVSATYFLIAEDITLLNISNGISIGNGKIALYNDYGKLQLFSSNNQLVSEVNYGDSKEGNSWESSGPLCSDLSLSINNSPGIVNPNSKDECFPNEQPVSYPENIVTIKSIEFSLDGVTWFDTLTAFTNTPIYIRYSTNTEVLLENVNWKDINGNILNNPHSFNSSYKNTIFVEATYGGKLLKGSSMSINIQNNISTTVIITELYPSPESPDKEWIEIYNNGDKDINLINYYFEEKSSSGITNSRSLLKDQIVKPKEYYVLYEDEFNVSLNNSGDSIYLFDIEGRQIDKFIYTESEKSKSVGRKIISEGFSPETFTTLLPTPLSENKFPEITSAINELMNFNISDINDLKSGTEFIISVNVNNYIDKYVFINDSSGSLKAKLTKAITEDVINTSIRTKAKIVTSNGIKNIIINPDDIEVMSYIETNYSVLDALSLNEANIGNQYKVNGLVKEVYTNRYKIEFNNQLLTIYSNNTSDITKGELVEVWGTLDYYRNNYRIIEIERISPEIKGDSIVNQDTNFTSKTNSLIEQPFQEDHSKIYLVTFGYITLGIIIMYELIKGRKSIRKIIKTNIIPRLNILLKPVIKY